MLVLREKTNHISIWIFIINVTKGISWSTYLKVVFHMKRWIPPTSCSFQLTQRWCAPTRRTYVYHQCFVTLVHSYIQVTARSIDYILFIRALGVSIWKPNWLKCFNLNIPLKYPNFLYEQTLWRKLKNTVNSDFTSQNARKIKKNLCLQQATNLALLGKLLQSYFVTII